MYEMKELLRTSVVLPQVLAVLCILSHGATQAGNKGHNTKPESSSYIERYYVAGAASDSTYDNSHDNCDRIVPSCIYGAVFEAKKEIPFISREL